MKKSYKRLVIDTATKYIYLALIVDQEVVETVYEQGNNNHSVTLMPYLNTMLSNHHIELKEIDEVIIGIGPGSYTGVRIGVTVAKMIAYLNDVKLYQVSSLAIMASFSDASFILPMIDARRGNAFMALFENKNQVLSYVKDDCLANIEDYQVQIGIEYQIVESGEPKIMKVIKSDLLTEIKDVHQLEPNYLQKTEAERKLKK